MNLNQSFQRWLAMTFVPVAPDKIAERALAKLWKKLATEKPLWYNPVGDRFGPATGAALVRLKEALLDVAIAFELTGEHEVPPSLVGGLIDRLFDKFVEKSQLRPEDLTFVAVQQEVASSRGGDYRAMQQTLQTRVQTLLKSEATAWQKALPTLEALVHLACFDWTPLNNMLPGHNGKPPKAQGHDFAEALEDLTFLLEPINIDQALVGAWTALTGKESLGTLNALKDARTTLIGDGRLLDVIRAIRSNPAHPFRWAAYQPSTLSERLKETVAEFDMELKQHQAAAEKLQLAKRLQDLFGARELQTFPGYNEETSALLIANKLPELRHAPAVKVLYNFVEVFHQDVFQPFFQAFQLEVDFAHPSAEEEFKANLDDYFKLTQQMSRFAEDFRSPTHSKLGPIFQTLQAPFVDPRLKLGLKKVLESVDNDADHVCQTSFQIVKRLHLLFEKYVLDLDGPAPKFFLGGAVLKSKKPELVQQMNSGAGVLKAMASVLRQMVVDLTDSAAKIKAKDQP